MTYDTTRKRRWLQRITLTLCATLIAASTIAVAGEAKRAGGYTLQFQVSSPDGRHVRYDFTITDKASGRILSQPRVTTQPNQQAEVTSGYKTPEDEVQFTIVANGTRERGTIRFEAQKNGAVVHSETFDYTFDADVPKYNGEPISINLKGAPLKDVMDTFAELTGLDVEVRREAADVLITMNVVGMPWDQALDEIARTHGLTITLAGKTLLVEKK